MQKLSLRNSQTNHQRIPRKEKNVRSVSANHQRRTTNGENVRSVSKIEQVAEGTRLRDGNRMEQQNGFNAKNAHVERSIGEKVVRNSEK